MHELLEDTFLTHDEIIAFTTDVLERGTYRPFSEVAATATDARKPVFQGPGQTPLGHALRGFIQWRLERWVESQVGQAASLTYFDERYQHVHGIRGIIMPLANPDDPNPLVRLREDDEDTIVPLDRIVSIERIFREYLRKEVTFHRGRAPLTSDDVLRSVMTEDGLVLSEPQLRSLRASPRTRLLAETLNALIALRDGEGQRLNTGGRLAGAALSAIYAEAVEISSRLARMEILLSFDNSLIGGFAAGQTFWYEMPPMDPDEVAILMAEQCAYALVTFTYVVLRRDISGRRLSHASDPHYFHLVSPKLGAAS